MKYHMRRKDREISDPAEYREILRQGRYLILALCRDGEPYIVTLNYGYDASRNAAYFHCARAGLKLDFIRQNRQTCATVIDDRGYRQTDCDHYYRSLVIRGELHVVTELSEQKHALDVLLDHLEDDPDAVREKMPIGDADYAKTVILRLDIREITGKQNPGPRPKSA